MKSSQNRPSDKQLTLSIGLIVKNEEHNLRSCLEALKPLLNKTSSELIIADTGSTDNTVSIAKEYTDNVFFFEWKDDFAAARNSTLKKATGKWYMHIDADEVLFNADELIDFLNSKESEKYKCVNLIVRNFYDVNCRDYGIVNCVRVFKMYEGIEFTGRIHESIYALEPIKSLNTYLNHTGYMHNDGNGLREKKHNRNITLLLKEHEEFKDDIRITWHITLQYIFGKEFENAEKFCYKTLKQAENEDGGRYYTAAAYSTLGYVLLAQDKFREIIDICGKYMSKKSNMFVSDIDTLYSISMAYDALKERESCCKTAAECYKLYDAYLSGNLTSPDVYFKELYLGNPFCYSRLSLAASSSANAMGQYETAYAFISRFDFNVMSVVDPAQVIGATLSIITEGRLFDCFPELYNKVKSTAPQNTQLVINAVEDLIAADQDTNEICKAFYNYKPLSPKTDSYAMLLHLRYYHYTKSRKVLDILADYAGKSLDEIPYLPDVLYIALENMFDLSPVFEKLDIEDMRKLIITCVTKYTNCISSVADYLKKVGDKDFYNTPKGFFYQAAFSETALAVACGVNEHSSAPLSGDMSAMLKLYGMWSFKYLESIYKPDVLSDTGILLIPRSLRFSYYFNKASLLLDNSDVKGAKNYLHLAVECYELMRAPVAAYIQLLQEQHKKPQAQTEFESYAAAVKSNIMKMINSGNKEAAKKLLDAYRDINPTDHEINTIAALI